MDNDNVTMTKIKFTFGDTVTINLTQNKEGFYNYTPKNNITSPTQFFSIKDAILFFSEFLPVKMYDKEESSLTFVVNIDYKNVGIAFYMSDEDRTKSGWIDYTTKSVGFSSYLKVNKEVDCSIDETIKHFINFVDKEEEDRDLSINGKTHLIKYEEENKEYYIMFTPFLRITGKSIDEVKEKIKEIYWAFGVDN